MDQSIVDKVTSYKDKGALIYFRHSSVGGGRIKVKHGPFKLLTDRFDTDIKTYEFLKQNVRSNGI